MQLLSSDHLLGFSLFYSFYFGCFFFFFSSRRRHTRCSRDWSSDVCSSDLRDARGSLQGTIAGDALRLPIADGAADIVTCSQLLHHFFDVDLHSLIAELHRDRKSVV